MKYQEALDWMMSFWETGRPKEQEKALRALKVPRMRALLERISSPHMKYPSILIAGTKGKGSTAAFVAECLRAAGYRVGRYTQPHLIDWRERTWVDGKLIKPKEVVGLVERIRPAVEYLHRGMGELGGCTTYEIGTALTLAHFADREVDVAVLEVGIGGRLDALNAVEPVISAVTSISFDHTDVLGDTLAEIASEKAGVFRQGRRAVSAPQAPEAEDALQRVVLEVGARLYLVGKDWRWRDGAEPGTQTLHQHGIDIQESGLGQPRRSTWADDQFLGCRHSTPGLRQPRLLVRTNQNLCVRTIDITGPEGVLSGVQIPLLGDHQRDNATVAVATLQLLARDGFRRIDGDAIRRGLAAVEWPGRIQVVRSHPLVVVDAAHNEDSVRRLLKTIENEFSYERLILVFGASGDKHIDDMVRVLGPAANRVIVTASGHRRAADVERLNLEFSRYGEVRTEPDPAAALNWAIGSASPEDLVLVAGSVFLAGRAIQVLSSEF